MNTCAIYSLLDVCKQKNISIGLPPFLLSVGMSSSILWRFSSGCVSAPPEGLVSGPRMNEWMDEYIIYMDDETMNGWLDMAAWKE